MDSYVIFKHLHMTAVALSGLLFMVRGLWLLQGSTQLQAKWVKITPHIRSEEHTSELQSQR